MNFLKQIQFTKIFFNVILYFSFDMSVNSREVHLYAEFSELHGLQNRNSGRI